MASGPSVDGTIVAIPRRSQVRRILAAISPRLATKTRRMASGVPEVVGAGVAIVPIRLNASNAPDATRHRPPTRRAGRTPDAIHRWTERVVAPILAAASLGLISSFMIGAIVAL